MQEIQTKTIIVSRLTGEIYATMEDVPKHELKHCRIQRDWSEVPSQADQSARDENNINVLIERYKPDEIAQYLAMKSTRPEIIGHDFSEEPDLQTAKNKVYQIKQQFLALPEEIQRYFDGKPTEFFKFCENPQNIPQLKQWGLTKPELPTEPLNAIKRDEGDPKAP